VWMTRAWIGARLRRLARGAGKARLLHRTMAILTTAIRGDGYGTDEDVSSLTASLRITIVSNRLTRTNHCRHPGRACGDLRGLQLAAEHRRMPRAVRSGVDRDSGARLGGERVSLDGAFSRETRRLVQHLIGRAHRCNTSTPSMRVGCHHCADELVASLAMNHVCCGSYLR